MNKIWLIVEREYLTRVTKKSFIAITLLGPLLLAAGLALIIWMSVSENTDQKVLVIDQVAPAFSNLKDTKNISYNYSPDLSENDAKNLFYESDYTCILFIPKNLLASEEAKLYYKKQPSVNVIRAIENQVEEVMEELRLKQFNIAREQFDKINSNFNLSAVKYSEKGEEEEFDKGKTAVGFAFGALIYIFIFLYGVQVMRGVIEEKSNRIIEVIVTSVKPFHLMLGKILGVGLVSLTQFTLWILLTVGIFTALQTTVLKDYMDPKALTEQVQATPEVMQEMQQEQSSAAKNIMDPNVIINRTNWPLMIGLFLFYFFGGYFLYSALFAAIGAAVDSETDTQQFMMPITLPLMIAYFFSLSIIKNPEGPIAFWLSIIPLTSPVTMLVRVALGVGDGGIPLWEVLLSMGLLILGFIGTVWLAAKIYRTGILMYGKKTTYKELWKWIVYKGN